MKRVLALAAVLLLPAGLAAAQSPPQPPKAPNHAPVRAVPVVAHQTPLILQAPLPTNSGFTPAPMPNLDISSPSAAQKVGPEFSGTLFNPRDATNVANGYTGGSQYSTDLERRRTGLGSSFAPTVSLKIPFVYANSNQ